MPKISDRGLEMPESPIRKLAPLAVAAKKRGIKVYHLNIGQPDLPTPQCGLDALKHIDRKVLEYSPSQGFLSYREKLCKFYAKYNINVEPDDIIITSGGSEAVLFAFMSCLNPGDEIIIPEPAYANYMSFAISAGAKIRTISTSIEEGFALPKVEKFEELINDRTRAVMICNPNNPTGYLYTRREMNQIRDMVKKHDLYLFSDEVYREYIYTGSPYISAMHLEGIEQNKEDGTAVVSACVFPEDVGQEFVLKGLLKKTEDGFWRLEEISNFREFIRFIAVSRQGRVKAYVEETDRIMQAHDAAIHELDKKFVDIVQTGNLSQDATRMALRKVMLEEILPDWQKRHEELAAVEVPQAAQTLHRLRLHICELRESYAKTYAEWLETKAAPTIRKANEMRRDVKEMESEAKRIREQMRAKGL